MYRVIDRASQFIDSARVASELGGQNTDKIDDRFMSIAESATAGNDSFFTCIGRSALTSDVRPDSINHHLTFLQPNAFSDEETVATLGLVNLMLGQDTTTRLTEVTHSYFVKHRIFDRIQATKTKKGEKVIIPSNHLQLPDQGFTVGLIQNAARKEGIDRIDAHLTAVLGRLIGYYQLGDKNVVDDILRKACSVLKTFPAGGTEALTEDEKDLSIYRKISNHRTKQAFKELLSEVQGRIVCMAPSGEQDSYDPELDAVVMGKYGSSTSELLIDASQSGALIVPLFADYGSDASIASYLDPIEPGEIKNRDDCDAIGDLIAAEGNRARAIAGVTSPNIKRFGQKVVYL